MTKRRLGSPPQVRGKPAQRLHAAAGRRITPAGAGKTCMWDRVYPCKEDHPRRCGENGYGPLRFIAVYGSPPQVRGKLVAVSSAPINTGITPAGAGKTDGFLHLGCTA